MAAPRLTRLTGLTRLNPGSPAGYAELLIRGRIDRARRRTRATPADLGASVVEWVIISAVLVTMAILVGGILLQKVKTKANSIDLNANTP